MTSEYSGIVSILALIFSMISTWIAYRAHRDSRESRQDELQLAFSRERSEFLVRIDRATKLFDHHKRRSEGLLAHIDSWPLHEQPAMADAVAQLRGELRYLEGCQRQVGSLRDEVYHLSLSGLAHHKPRFLALIEDDEKIVSERALRSEVLGVNALTQPELLDVYAQSMVNPVKEGSGAQQVRSIPKE